MEPPAPLPVLIVDLAQAALQFGRPVLVQFDGSGASELLNVVEDLPYYDFVLYGNWDFFANCPDWKDEHIELLRGIHFWADSTSMGHRFPRLACRNSESRALRSSL